jgi:hypothetical protein
MGEGRCRPQLNEEGFKQTHEWPRGRVHARAGVLELGVRRGSKLGVGDG